MATLPRDESLAYHAARVLLLIARCGTPRSARAAARPGIHGRTLLAKLDFFLRYPEYLRRAAALLRRPVGEAAMGETYRQETTSVESRMVRYRYGPWDHLYYPV